MPREGLEAALRKALPVQSVSQLEKFPFKTHAEFIRAMGERRVEVLTAFDSSALVVLANEGEKAIHYVLTWSPFLTAAACLVAAVMLSTVWPLLGVPLTVVGMFLSIPGFMRSVGRWLNRGLLLLLIYFWYQGSVTSALLVFSYLCPNFLCNLARHHCRAILVRSAAESELILVWLFQKGSLVPVVRPSSLAA